MPMPRRLLREPLFHFAVLGAVLFALHARFAPDPSRRIDVDASVRRGLRQEHLRRTGAPPTAAEEDALIERFVESEMLHREALALGLDRGDVIVRRRLVQKMEFVAEALEPIPEPSDEELRAHVAAHPERWSVSPRVGFEQVFVSRERHGAGAGAEAVALRERLVSGDDPSALGDGFARGRRFGPASEREIDAAFGPGFGAAVMPLPDGSWSAPLPSSYGFHLVRVTAREPGAPPHFDAVRSSARRDWEEEQRAARRRRAIDGLRRRYRVTIAPAAATEAP